MSLDEQKARKVMQKLVANGELTDPDSARGKLLQAAAHLFRSKGYERTTVRDLASAVGIQSGSIFHHFKSKDEILEELLQEVLSLKPAALTSGHLTGEGALHALIDEIYAMAADPRVLALMRVVIMEGARVPHLIRQWRLNVLHPQMDAHQVLVDELVAQGVVQRSPMTETFQFFLSPVANAIILHLMLGEEGAEDVEAVREAHLRMVRVPAASPVLPVPPVAPARDAKGPGGGQDRKKPRRSRR